MTKRQPSGKTLGKRRTGGPGLLTRAWLGLFAVIAGGAIMIQLFGNSESKRAVVNIAIVGEPDRFAPVPDPSALTTLPIPIDSEEDDSGNSTSIEKIPEPVPEEFIEPPNTPVATREDALAAEGDSAAIIRVKDLPTQSSSNAISNKTINVTGTPPRGPSPELALSTTNGPYPRISPDGRKPSIYYRRGFDDPADRPRIAIIVAGLGLSTNLTAQAINDLPPEVTLAFAPYAKSLPQWTAQARKAGHELMIELPMETAGLEPEALGPAALLSSRTENENRQRLNWLLARFQGYFAVTNYLGSKFSNDASAISPVYDQVRNAGIAFIADTEIEPGLLQASGLPATTVDLLITNNVAAPVEQLVRLETLARQKEMVLVKIYPTEQSLSAISLWAKGLRDKGIALAPASTMLQ